MNYLRDLFNSIIGTRYTKPEVVDKSKEVEVVYKSKEVEKSNEVEVVEEPKEVEVVEKPTVVEEPKEVEEPKDNEVDSNELCRKQIKRSEDLRSSIHDMNNRIDSLTTMTSSKNSSTLLDTKTLSNDFNKNTKRYKKNSSSITKE